MIRGNLSTRPFYNERAVHVLLGIAAVALAAVTALNVSTIVLLSARQTELTARIARDEARAAALLRETAVLRREIDATALRRAIDAAHEANTLIDRRTFSWTALFNHLETTLPPDVILTAIRPEVRDGRVWVNLSAVGRSVASLGTFADRLEETGAFAEVLSRQEEAQAEGTYRAMLRGVYLAARPRDGGAVGPAEVPVPGEDEDEGGGDVPRGTVADTGGRRPGPP